MTNQSFPITPPPEELLDKWEGEWHHYQGQYTYEMFMAEQAAQWGADQELEACCEWIRGWYGSGCGELISGLRAARRPKPPSLRKQAYDALDTYIYGEPDPKNKERIYNTIRRVLEALPND